MRMNACWCWTSPPGVAVHGGSGLSFGVIEALRASRPSQTLELAHRLDRDTSGCLLVAKRSSALRALHALLREGAVQKSYLALVAGRWNLGHKSIDAPLRTDLRVGGERTVKVRRARQGGADRVQADRALRRARLAAGGDAAHRAHASDPRACGLLRPSGRGR